MNVKYWTPYLEGQELISVPSPTAANLGLYGEIPVSHFTGTPNIEIPLYELECKGVKVPISLNYHPAGIRPLIHPGPTGLGWSLHAGGAITRTIRGTADEYKNVKATQDAYTDQGYYYATNMLNSNTWKTFFDDKNCNALWTFYTYSKDMEPDEFNFTFLGVSGKFYLAQDGLFKVQCDRPVKVEFEENDFIDPKDLGHNWAYQTSKTFKKFTLIDEFGTKYIFGEDAIEFSNPITRDAEIGSVTLRATSWFLKKIVPVDGSSIIVFDYEKGPIISHLYDSSYELGIMIYDKVTGSKWAFPGNVPMNIRRSGSFIYPVYLKKIQHNNTEIFFSYSKSNEYKYDAESYQELCPFTNKLIDFYTPMTHMYEIDYYKTKNFWSQYDMIEWWKLDKIEIQADKALVRKVDFSYLENPDERLFLDSVSIKGNDFDPNPKKYIFGYKDRDKLTGFGFTCVDNWGFCSGRLDVYQGRNDGYVDENFNQSGVLSKIIYPTGGSTSFEYQANSGGKVVDYRDRTSIRSVGRGKVGGLRIYKILSEDNYGNQSTKQYYYNSAYLANQDSISSSGVLNAELLFELNGANISNCYSKNQTFSFGIKRSIPMIPLTNYNGGIYIGYTTVFEKLVNGPELGFKQYTYSNHDNGYCDYSAIRSWNETIFWEIPHCSRSFERGRLLNETTYDADKKMVAEKEIKWGIVGDRGESNNVRALKFGCFLENPELGLYSNNAYLNYIYKFVKTNEIEKIKNTVNDSYIINTVSYSYNTLGLLKTKTVTSSDNQILLYEYKYPEDYKTVFPYSEMVQMYNHSPVIETSLKVDGIYVSTERTEYKKWDSGLILPEFVKKGVASGDLEQRFVYHNYNSQGNPLFVSKDYVENTVYLWGYANQYLIAEIKNVSYVQVVSKISGGETAIRNLASSYNPDMGIVNQLRTDLPNALITTYTYKPLIGVHSITDPRNIKTIFDYDFLGRLNRVTHDGKVTYEYDYNYSINESL